MYEQNAMIKNITISAKISSKRMVTCSLFISHRISFITFRSTLPVLWFLIYAEYPTNSKQKLYLQNSLKTFFQRRLKLFTSPLRYLGTVGTLRVSLGTTWQSAAYSPSAVGLRLLRFRVIENYEREQRKTCRYHESTFTQSDNPEKTRAKGDFSILDRRFVSQRQSFLGCSDSESHAVDFGFHVSATWIPDSNSEWDSGFLELYSIFYRSGFCIPQAKIS